MTHPNYKLILAYDGTNLLGWQKTREGRSVEEELEKVLYKIYQKKIPLQAASRTDAGVHALGQVVNVHLESVNRHLPISLNQLLPEDISLVSIEEVHDSFHPSVDALAKEYHYRVRTTSYQIPQERKLVWHYPHRLNLQKMRSAADKLLGTHDFGAFCNLTDIDCTRTLYKIEITEPSEREYLFKVEGNRFLYRMMRILVGTLVQIGRGVIDEYEIEELLKNGIRKEAGMTAPAHGLTLYRVKY